MAVDITITLTDAEYRGLEMVAYSPQEWVHNVASVRAQKAIAEIANEIVQETLAAGGSVSGTPEQIVLNSDRQTAKEITDALDAEIEASANT